MCFIIRGVKKKVVMNLEESSGDFLEEIATAFAVQM